MPGIITSSVIASGCSSRASSQALLAARAPQHAEAFLRQGPPQQVAHRADRRRSPAPTPAASATSARPPPLRRRLLAPCGSTTSRRQPDRERGALSQLALDRDVAAHHPAEAAADRQPEAGAAELARRRGVGLREGLEQLAPSAPASCRCRCRSRGTASSRRRRRLPLDHPA